MIKLLFKQIWNQRSKNVWIVLELFMVFVLIWCIVDFFSVLAITSRTPIGYDISNTYKVTLLLKQPDNPNYIQYEEGSPIPGENFIKIADRIRQHPDVSFLTFGTNYYPYCNSNSTNVFMKDSLKTFSNIVWVTPEFFQVFQIKSNNGDDSKNLTKQLKDGVIISEMVEATLFPKGKATGQFIIDGDSNLLHVNAVTSPRKQTLFNKSHPYVYVLFDEASLIGKSEQDIWKRTDICIRVNAKTSEKDFIAKFEKEMKTQLAIGNYFLAELTSFTDLKEDYYDNQNVTTEMQYRIAFSLFFLVNLFLGIIGTFWLRIEKRKSEIGLRIAVGSTKNKIMKQMLTEGFLLLSIAAIPALIVCVNLVYFEILSTERMDFTPERFILNTLLTVGLLSLIIALATWYPARRSSLIPLAEALHYE